MKILAFLQNQWFRDPERIRAIYASKPTRRADLNRAFLFAGCMTGRRLRAAFGDLCREIVWEEISKEIGGHASACFKPDHEHISSVIREVRPDVVLVFGKPAEKALIEHHEELILGGMRVIFAPHPAARGKDVPARLAAAADQLGDRS